jgi:predicted 3-demethylubiquinone-9 3-methyltransferase (glyoxalase superfamily)
MIQSSERKPRVGRLLVYLRANALGAAALFIALGGTSWAVAHGFIGKRGIITGCADQHSGALRLAKPGHKCGKHRVRVVWNQTGPQGPTGMTGAVGAQGQKGDQGIQGIRGHIGPTGVTHITTRTSSISFTVDGATGEEKTATANCQAGEKVVGGGYSMPEKQIWGDEFGACTDRFGVSWMINISQPQATSRFL